MQNGCGRTALTLASWLLVSAAQVAVAGPGEAGDEARNAIVGGADAAATLSPGSLAADFQATVGDRVFFSDNSAELGGRARAALAAQAQWLLAHPAVYVILEGHADDQGGSDLYLSHRRAEAVRAQLIEFGVAPGRIEAVGYGRARSVVECASPACAVHNRRVVTRVEWLHAAGAPQPDDAAWRDHATVRRAPRRLF